MLLIFASHSQPEHTKIRVHSGLKYKFILQGKASLLGVPRQIIPKIRYNCVLEQYTFFIIIMVPKYAGIGIYRTKQPVIRYHRTHLTLPILHTLQCTL